MRECEEKRVRQALEHPVFHIISETADRLGMECYVIGGFVRDLFLGRASNDLDFVVVGSGIRMAQAVADAIEQRSGRRPHLSVFANFGTAQIRAGRVELEFVGARRESYSHDSRKPVVEDGTLEDDQNRRDFTINDLALCLNGPRYGELLDPFDGMDDLERGIIRTPLDPDITFSDDPLRMLRCIRFATQLNFMIQDETSDALQRNAERISIISAERIIDELNKIMLAPHPSKGLVELQRSGLLRLILPEVSVLEGVENMNGQKHKDIFDHTMGVLENVVKAQAEPGWGTGSDDGDDESPVLKGHDQTSELTLDERRLYLRWAALLHDIGKPKSKRLDPLQGWTFHHHDHIGQKMVMPLFRRLKLPLDYRMRYVERLVGLHMRPAQIADEEVTDSAVRRLVFEAGADIDDLITLCNADITSKSQLKREKFQQNYRKVMEKIAALKRKDRERLFQPVIGGEEIMRLFGLPPSPAVGELKKALKQAVINMEIPNEHEASVAFLKAKGEEMGLKILEVGK